MRVFTDTVRMCMYIVCTCTYIQIHTRREGLLIGCLREALKIPKPWQLQPQRYSLNPKPYVMSDSRSFQFPKSGVPSREPFGNGKIWISNCRYRGSSSSMQSSMGGLESRILASSFLGIRCLYSSRGTRVLFLWSFAHGFGSGLIHEVGWYVL